MTEFTAMDLRCANCGGLVDTGPDGGISTCAYCGAKYYYDGSEFVGEDSAAAQKDGLIPPQPPTRSRIWIEVKSFRSVMWLAAILYVAVVGIGWAASKIPSGGIILLAMLVLWFASALVGRLLPKPPSWVAQMSAWSLGNLFPMGLVWGLLVSSGISAILFSSGVTAGGGEDLLPPEIAGAFLTGEAQKNGMEPPKSVELPPIDGTCATIPALKGWRGFHEALAAPGTRSDAINVLSTAPNAVVAIGGSVARFEIGADDAIHVAFAVGNEQFVEISKRIAKGLRGAVLVGVAANAERLALALNAGKTRRLLLVNPATWRATTLVTLPGKLAADAGPPSIEAGDSAFSIAWEEGRSVVGAVVNNNGRIISKWRLKGSAQQVEPRVAWNGANIGVLFGGLARGLPEGLGVIELNSKSGKPAKGKRFCDLGRGWSDGHSFMPNGSMIWLDGVYHVAGTVSPDDTAAPWDEEVLLHCTPGGEATLERCGNSIHPVP
ncbi:MAG: hypothetical protein M0R80_25875 [Proteobacteria bacterium]|jgi:hypothetical protein|nr:hypothetical protein [Pseudomonadota bacterium]